MSSKGEEEKEEEEEDGIEKGGIKNSGRTWWQLAMCSFHD